VGELASEAEAQETAGFEYEVSVDAAESRDQLSDNGRIWMLANWELEVEVLNGLCYCRFRREAIGGCGVEWRTAGLRRGRAKRLRIRIGELMDMRVGSYFCFCSEMHSFRA
jgi:hypothetical protein